MVAARVPPRWFDRLFGLDVRSLALLRVGLASLLLTDLVRRSVDLTAHYSDAGVMPISLLPRPGVGQSDISLPFSLHLISGSPAYQALLFAIAALAAGALLVGWRTRLATIVAWFLTTSLHARNPLVCDAGDAVLRLLLFWSMFLPLGACASLDARSRPAPPPRVRSLATAALILQMCVIFWFAALMKYDPAWRSDGDAIYRALVIADLRTAIGDWLLHARGLMTFLTFATLIQEGFVPFLLFIPWKNWIWRLAVIGSFVLFHGALALCMRLGYFQGICILGWWTLLPTETWDWFTARLRRRTEPDAATAALPSEDLDLEPAREQRSLVQPLGVGANLAVLFLFSYGIADNVDQWNEPRSRDEGLALQKLLDVRDAVRSHFQIQNETLGAVLGLNCNWYLFAPRPPVVHGWLVLDATLDNGRHVDLLPVCMGRHETLVTFGPPQRGGPSDPNSRWRKYLDNLIAIPPDKLAYRQALAAYAVETWNRDHMHDPGQRVRSLEVVLMRATTLPNYQPPRLDRIRLVKLDGHATDLRAPAAVDLNPVALPY